MRAQIFCKFSAIILCVIGLVSGSAFAAVGQLYDASGEVKTALGSQIEKAVGKGASLQNDMIVTTGDRSHAVLKFEDGQVIALQANTSFRIHDYHYNRKEVEKSNMFFSMLKGGLRAITGLIGSKHRAAFKLETNTVTIGIRGTDFMVVMSSDQMYSNVVSGSISMSNAAGTAVFSAGQTALAASATTLPAAISAAVVPAGTFTQLSAISMPSPTPGARIDGAAISSFGSGGFGGGAPGGGDPGGGSFGGAPGGSFPGR